MNWEGQNVSNFTFGRNIVNLSNSYTCLFLDSFTWDLKISRHLQLRKRANFFCRNPIEPYLYLKRELRTTPAVHNLIPIKIQTFVSLGSIFLDWWSIVRLKMKYSIPLRFLSSSIQNTTLTIVYNKTILFKLFVSWWGVAF